MSLIDLARQHISESDIQQIAQQLGTDAATTQQAVDAALPMIVGGMAHTAQQPGGEQTIQSLSSAGTAESLGGLGGMLGGALGGGAGGGMGGILGSILGQHHSTVQDGVQKASGLDAGKVGKLLMLLMPFVLRALAKHQSSPAAQGQGGGLGDVLQKEAQSAQTQTQSPQVGGVLGKILASVTG